MKKVNAKLFETGFMQRLHGHVVFGANLGRSKRHKENALSLANK